MPLGGDRGVGLAVLTEGVDGELAAEDLPVGLHRLPRVAVEGDVRVQDGSHAITPCQGWASSFAL
jgi:hypothetical protein